MRLALVLALFGLAACGDRRSFDERYNETGAELEERAQALEANLANEMPAAEGNAS